MVNDCVTTTCARSRGRRSWNSAPHSFACVSTPLAQTPFPIERIAEL